MSNVSVAQLAEVLGVDVGKLIAQLNDAGIDASSAEDDVSNEDKKKLLAYLRASHGKVASDATAPKKVTLKRKSVSELRVPGTGPRARATARTVNVEVRKRRTYVKRDQVDVVFVTTDPERDTGEVLREYLDRFDPSFIGVTGPIEEIAAVGKSVAVGMGEQLPTGGYDVDAHTTQVTGIDRDDKAPIYWSQTTSSEQFAQDIHTLLGDA